VALADESGFELGRKETKLAGTKLAIKFAVTQVKGDWKWLVEIFSLWNCYWKTGRTCHRCKAARLPRHQD